MTRDTLCNRFARLGALATLSWLTALGFAEDTGVAITGGGDDNGQNYVWTVANHTDSAITRIDFPHYHGDQFNPPAGWKNECTYLVNVGVPDQPGHCVAYVDYAMQGLQPGRSAQFHLRISRAGANRRPGTVTVTFADGSTLDVDGVELPTQATLMERYVGLMGFAALFLIVLVVHARRRKKTGDNRSDSPEATEDAA